jgi:phosphoribosylamine---glycine ligase
MSQILEPQRILIIGGGGREHALYWKLSKSPMAGEILVMPGNAGIPESSRIKTVDVSDFSEILHVVQLLQIDLVVVGPEQLIVDGLGNYLYDQAPKVRFFGPSKKAASLEGSKAFCKSFCERHLIPTADFRIAFTIDQARAIVEEWGVPIVIKADGLCGGKGVTVATTFADAHKALDDLFVNQVHGNAGEMVVIERMLVGRECSVMALCDGKNIELLSPARDYKRLRSGAEGLDNPNTGGMGAYSPLPDVDDSMLARIRSEILMPIVTGMMKEGRVYKGLLYAGIMVTKEGPMLLEVNCRPGDPETQAVLPRLTSDLLPYLFAVCTGTLDDMKPLEWSDKFLLCVTEVAEGYPASTYKKGDVIEGLSDASESPYAYVFHAGTEVGPNGEVLTKGGRVLNIVGSGRNIREASDNAYMAANCISWPGKYHRTDIGK